jgi:phospholipid/cholesterol/gamma-HCH transport system permease protein
MRKTAAPTGNYSIKVAGEQKEAVVFLSGRLALEDLKALRSETRGLFLKMAPARLAVDLAGVTYLDSAGALVLLEMAQEAKSRAVPCDFVHPTPEVQGILGLIDPASLAVPPLISERQAGLLEQVGEATLSFLGDLTQVMTFLGELLLALFNSLAHPRAVRWGEVLFYLRRAGVDGLPIVGLISILLGLIIAFMSSLQLKDFGANIYVASLLGIAMVKELGPIMTAILVAGRSGSAYAAEIGTMMVNEEVDAMVTMGLDPVRFLAVPKVLATAIAVPLLTLYADLFGILGGLIVGVWGLDLTVYSYITETQRSLDLFDLTSSLIKAVVFAVLIAGIGCQRGFQVRGGAESVGAATTSAVVTAIFLIVVTDSAFALVLNYIR